MRIERDEYDAAESILRIAVNEDGAVPEIWFNLGVALNLKGQYQESAVSFMKSSRIYKEKLAQKKTYAVYDCIPGEGGSRSARQILEEKKVSVRTP